MPKALQLQAQYGFLTVLGRVRGGIHCRCICGKETFPQVQAVVRGVTKSCGCHGGVKLRRKLDRNKDRAEYNVWRDIKKRCLNPRSQAYRHYGGRGITVHPEWAADFRAFLRDVGDRPTLAHSLDRIDNEGNYEPGNVRWATTKEQARNTRRNRLITYRGETLCISEMCERHGKNVDLVWQRIHVYGWSVADAIEIPSRLAA